MRGTVGLSSSTGSALCLLAVILAACVAPPVAPVRAPATTAIPEATSTPGPTPVLTPTGPPPARLVVRSLPAGAHVSVDAQPRGLTPLTLTLPAGSHVVSVAAEGYAPITDTVTLAAGGDTTHEPALADIEPPRVTLSVDAPSVAWDGHAALAAAASDNAAVASLEVRLGDAVLAAASSGALETDVVPARTAGMAPNQSYTLTARAADAAGNVGEASVLLMVEAAATATPEPTATPTAAPAASPTPVPTAAPPKPTAPPATTRLTMADVIIPTYPYTRYLASATVPELAGYPVRVIDRGAYDGSGPQPVPVRYELVVLENRYLRLSILPELGGRIYECIFKPTGNDELYRNPVVKPTNWGPPQPAGANWWLGVGGIEWGFPVEEHGYEFGTRWGFDHAALSDGSMMVTVFTKTGPGLPYAVVDVILPPETAYFVVRPRIVNPLTSVAFRFKWWANAMLAPGAANQPGPDLRFILPATEVTVHSRGDESLPGAGQALPWPVYNGRDLSRLGAWTRYLGVFQRPQAAGGFAGVYDPSADEGLLRIYPPDVARGAKLFAMGWSDPVDWHLWTDDGSGYVELHGGLMPTFDEWYELPPGGQVSWRETWYPVAGIGGVTYANEDAALALAPTADGLRVSLFPTVAVRGTLTVALPGMAPDVRPVEAGPAQPLIVTVPLAEGVPATGEASLVLTDMGGATVFAYRGAAALRP